MRQDIRRRLIEAARAGEVIFYRELGIGRGRVAGEILEDISEYEYEQHRPLLSAIVANRAKGMPSLGFWELPSAPRNLSERQRPVFWARELIRVIDWWQSHPSQE